MSDHVASLVERARLAERDAVDALFDTAFPRLLTYVRFQAEDPAISEEIAVDVLLAAARELGSETIASELDLFCWLFRIVRNRLEDHRSTLPNRATKSPQGALASFPRDADTPEEPRQASGAGEIHQALLLLPRDQREVVICTCLLGFSSTDVAYMLSLRPDEAERLLYRGLAEVDALLSASRSS